MLSNVAALFALVVLLLWSANQISYRFIKNRVLRERRWDYNICCGVTDGGGINADIVQHAAVPNFERVSDVTRLRHADQAFDTVLCSHTLEHVDNPLAMFAELQRVGRRVTVLIPPLWDLAATLNPLEHRVIFLSFASRHENRLPRFVRFAPACWLQNLLGQRIDAGTSGEVQSAERSFALRPVFELLMPLVWASAALLLYLKHWAGWAMFGTAVVVWRLSRRQRPLFS